MKFRADFVTNSSSSSFLICKKYLSEEQIEAIKHHSELGTRLGLPCAEEDWNIEENEFYISGYTDMDNFDFEELFRIIGVNEDAIAWDDIPFTLPKKLPRGENHESASKWREILHDILSKS